MVVWLYGCMGVKVYGCMGVWVYGHILEYSQLYPTFSVDKHTPHYVWSTGPHVSLYICLSMVNRISYHPHPTFTINTHAYKASFMYTPNLRTPRTAGLASEALFVGDVA